MSVTTYFPTGLAICPPYLAPSPSVTALTTNFNPSLQQLQPNLTNTIAASGLHPHQPPPPHHSHHFIPSTLTNSQTISNNYHHHHHTTNIQINQSQAAAAAAAAASAHNPTALPFCYCGHCCPPPVVSAIAPTLILSRYTEINLCDSLALRNQSTAQALNSCSTIFANSEPSSNSFINGNLVNGTINNINNNNTTIITSTTTTTAAAAGGAATVAVTANIAGNGSNQFVCKEVMVSRNVYFFLSCAQLENK